MSQISNSQFIVKLKERRGLACISQADGEVKRVCYLCGLIGKSEYSSPFFGPKRTYILPCGECHYHEFAEAWAKIKVAETNEIVVESNKKAAALAALAATATASRIYVTNVSSSGVTSSTQY